jgi:hypothetical protein
MMNGMHVRQRVMGSLCVQVTGSKLANFFLGRPSSLFRHHAKSMVNEAVNQRRQADKRRKRRLRGVRQAARSAINAAKAVKQRSSDADHQAGKKRERRRLLRGLRRREKQQVVGAFRALKRVEEDALEAEVRDCARGRLDCSMFSAAPCVM